jgi:hypothetical protein
MRRIVPPIQRDPSMTDLHVLTRSEPLPMTDPTAPPPTTAADAVRLKVAARRKRALAPIMREEWADPIGARFEMSEAAAMDARANEVLDPLTHSPVPIRQGNGGEAVVEDRKDPTEQNWIRDTLKDRPDMLNAEASGARLELVAAAGFLTMAVDAAESVKAANSVERMLVHQMATAHKVAMTMAAKAGDFASSIKSWDSTTRQQVQSIEAARMAGAAARMMETFQRAALTLERLRNGGKQVVVVQHVTVADGGQAVVAGAVTGGGQTK